MNREIIVDTSALVAFFVRSETHHQAAIQYLSQHPKTRWIILETVFDETVTLLRARISSQIAIQAGQFLRREHRYVNLSDNDDAETWNIFCRYDDKRWSYTDCSILVMVYRLEVFKVFSFDEHIRQMAGLGIICVP